MTDSKLRIYPTGSSVFNTAAKMYDYMKEEKQEVHHGDFYHTTDTSHVVTIDNGSNWSQGPYKGEVKGYTTDGGNPFGKMRGRHNDQVDSITLNGQSWDHSYETHFKIGGGGDKLWLPNITGLAMDVRVTNKDNSNNQKSFLRSIAIAYYRQYDGSKKVLQLPFETHTSDNITCILHHKESKFIYSTLSSSDRSIIFDKNYMFDGVWFRVYILRNGSIAKEPEVNVFGCQPIMHSNGSHFIVPKDMRSTQNTTSPIRYI